MKFFLKSCHTKIKNNESEKSYFSQCILFIIEENIQGAPEMLQCSDDFA